MRDLLDVTLQVLFYPMVPHERCTVTHVLITTRESATSPPHPQTEWTSHSITLTCFYVVILYPANLLGEWPETRRRAKKCSSGVYLFATNGWSRDLRFELRPRRVTEGVCRWEATEKSVNLYDRKNWSTTNCTSSKIDLCPRDNPPEIIIRDWSLIVILAL